MIDVKKLREHAESHGGYAIGLTGCTLTELLDRLEAAEQGHAGALAVANGWKDRALSAERDAEEWEHFAHQYQAERDALAAHNRVIQEGLSACESVIGQITRGKPYRPTEQESSVLNTELIESSFARLKAQWQFEALEQMLGVNDVGVERKMIELQQQSEGSPMTHQCECIETAIRELLQGNGYDMRIIDGQLVFISARVIDVGLENPELMVRQLMGGRHEHTTD